MSVPKGWIWRDVDYKKDSLELAIIIDSIYGYINHNKEEYSSLSLEDINYIVGESFGELLIESLRKSKMPSSMKKEFIEGLKGIL